MKNSDLKETGETPEEAIAKELPKKTLIGVLASRDNVNVNQELVDLFNWLSERPKILENFHFIFTGGTYDRIIKGIDPDINPVTESTLNVLKECGITRLPSSDKGGIPIFSYFISQKLCSIVWVFLAPHQNHWLRAENLALMRLCDQWHVKRLMNRRSVQVWYEYEAKYDDNRNLQKCPPTLIFREGNVKEWPYPCKEAEYLQVKTGKLNPDYIQFNKKNFIDMTVALIAHDEMKSRMIEFAIDHESELRKFGSILATGTTGREVAAATSRTIDEKIFRYHSGPKGGDIEIATEIVLEKCDIVIFLIDTLNPHPHKDDILVVFQACMINPRVLMITNEMHAREFMRNVVRVEKDGI